MECTCISLEQVDFDHFAAKWFQECLYEFRERASFYVGMSSLLFWVLCMVPQIIKHYQTQKCEGLAGMLLGFWLFGDSLNLIGSVLTHQLAFQKVSAMIFCCMDMCMIFQFFYYAKPPAAVATGGGGVRGITTVSQPLLVVAVALVVFLPAPAFGLQDEETAVIPFCEPVVKDASKLYSLGSMLGWVSTACYLSSRFSQIYSNYQYFQLKKQEEEEENLAILENEEQVFTIEEEPAGAGKTMFVFAIMANSLYSAGILLNFKTKAMPWLFGSLAVLFLDVIIVHQEDAKTR